MKRMRSWVSSGFERAVHVFHAHERFFMLGGFIVGFIFDNLTLTRIDFWPDILILFIYLMLAGGMIFLINAVEVGILRRSFLKNLASWAPFIMQFSFGNLFSGYIVFYFRSGTFAAAWPFMILLLFMFVGNEFFKKKYQRLGFQMSVFFLVLFSFTIFYMPILVGSIGALVFLLSGAVSLGVIALFIYLFQVCMPYRMRTSKRVVTRSIAGLFLVINLFYFANVIPPLPLSLKTAGVYHSVERVAGGKYVVTYEKKHWYEFLKMYETYHHVVGEKVFVYSAVFSPTGLDTSILHRWEYWNEKTGRWEEADRFGFPIYGGSDRGYRGYSFKASVTPGRWRVDVITNRGQVLGRVKFEVVFGPAKIVTETL